MNSQRHPWFIFTFLLGTSLCLTTAYPQGGAVRRLDNAEAGPQRSAGGKEKHKIREGAVVEEKIGRFDFIGDRMGFYPIGESDSFRVLENLSLERVWQVVQDTDRKQEWVVSGVVTEFRGANFLLLTKAVMRVKESQVSLSK